MNPNNHTTIHEAAEIMGPNFYGPDVMEFHFGVRPLSWAAWAVKRHQKVPFSVEVLQAHNDTHLLVACGHLSFMDVWRAQTGLFDIGFMLNPWFGESEQYFARSKLKAGWQLVNKYPVMYSFNKTWDEQVQLLGAYEQVPSTSVLAQAMFIHYRETEERLFETFYVRTADMGSGGNRVHFGRFNDDGLMIYDYWGEFKVPVLGLASSRMPS